MHDSESRAAVISQFYSDTGHEIKVGDQVTIDVTHPGRVVGVFLPATRDAADYNCFKTGGLLIEMDEYGLTMEPFGTNSEIRKLE